MEQVQQACEHCVCFDQPLAGFSVSSDPNIAFGTGAVFAAVGGWVCEGLHWPKVIRVDNVTEHGFEKTI